MEIVREAVLCRLDSCEIWFEQGREWMSLREFSPDQVVVYEGKWFPDWLRLRGPDGEAATDQA